MTDKQWFALNVLAGALGVLAYLKAVPLFMITVPFQWYCVYKQFKIQGIIK